MPFHCMPWFFSGKGWQLTPLSCVQHTRRLIRVQHTKYYLHASYNRAAHEDGSRAVHEIELACSTRKITLVYHVSLVRVTRQKYKTTRVLLHASVNLEMSCIVFHNSSIAFLYVTPLLTYTQLPYLIQIMYVLITISITSMYACV